MHHLTGLYIPKPKWLTLDLSERRKFFEKSVLGWLPYPILRYGDCLVRLEQTLCRHKCGRRDYRNSRLFRAACLCVAGRDRWAGMMREMNLSKGVSVMAVSFLVASSALADQIRAESGALPVLVKRSDRPDSYLSNLVQGRLFVDENGCLRFGQQGSLVIWHPDTQVLHAADGRIQIIDGVTGKAIHVGEEIGTSGIHSEEPLNPARLLEPVSEDCSSGPHIFAGPIMTEAELHALQERWRHRKPVPAPHPRPQ